MTCICVRPDSISPPTCPAYHQHKNALDMACLLSLLAVIKTSRICTNPKHLKPKNRHLCTLSSFAYRCDHRAVAKCMQSTIPIPSSFTDGSCVLSMHDIPCSQVAVCRRIVSPLACGGDRSAMALAIARPAPAEVHALKQFLLQAAELLLASLAGCLW